MPAASLVALRMGFGLLMALALLRFWSKGWIQTYYLEPRFFFSYPGLSWLRPWPGPWGPYLHVGGLIAVALALAAGWRQRLMAALFCLGFTWLELIDKTPYLNHYYAISLIAFWLIWLPLDRRTTDLHGAVPRWGLLFLRIQVGVIYVYAGLAKLNGDWLLRAEPLQRWLNAWSALPLVGPWLDWPPTAYAMSWAGMLFDLTIPLWLLWGRTRPWAYAAVVVFHLLTALLFPIGVFPWVMMGLALLFFPPETPLRLWRRFGLRFRQNEAEAPAVARFTGVIPPQPKFPLWVLLLPILLWQLLFPLRHVIYPGDSRWTNAGFRFAWKVMLIEKTGHVEYRLVDPVSGQYWRVDPREHLTPFQAQMLRTQPDMIHQFAHELGRRWQVRGFAQIQVYADAWASLNGRPSQRLLDPACDLLKQPLGVGLTPCVLPLKAD
ncbi:MAG: HTTM domain-containing protein [Candidatus Sericytochromatia bacterium]